MFLLHPNSYQDIEVHLFLLFPKRAWLNGTWEHHSTVRSSICSRASPERFSTAELATARRRRTSPPPTDVWVRPTHFQMASSLALAVRLWMLGSQLVGNVH